MTNPSRSTRTFDPACSRQCTPTSAMRIPALVEGYCLSICSADFNEWVLKNA